MNVKALLPVGSTLRLTQVLEIPEDRTFIYIANGKVAPLKNFNTVNIYEPHCMFHLDKAESYQRQVLPDEFEITSIVEWETEIFARQNSIKAVSAFNRRDGLIKTGGASENDGGSNIVMYATILSLRSDKQPEVKEMVCGHWNDPSELEPLTLEEMKSALGDLILINKVGSNIRVENNTRLI